MKEIYNSIFGTETISEDIYNNILVSISLNDDLKKLIPRGIGSISDSNNTLLDIAGLTAEEISKMPEVGKGKLRKIQDFQNKIKEDRAYFIKYYILNKAIITVPFEYNEEKDVLESFYEMMRDLATVYKLRNSKKSNQIAEIIKLYYGIENKIHDRGETASNLRKSKQRIDQILTKSEESVIMQLFSTNTHKDRIEVDADFLDKVLEIKNKTLYNNKFLNEITSSGDVDFKLAKLFTENLQCSLTEIEDDIFLVEQSNAVVFREHYRALRQTMNNQVEPLLLEEIYDLVSLELDNQTKLNKDLINILLEQDIYEKIITDEDETKYSIEWNLLSSVLAKVKRILFEESQPLLRDEILTEFNYRLSLKNLDPILSDLLIFKGDGQLHSLGNNNWIYSNADEPILNNRLNTWSFISEYVKNQGGISNFEDIKNAIEIEHYHHPDSSIRAYILKSCYISKVDKNSFLHKEFADKHPGFKYSKPRRSEVGRDIIRNAITILKNNDYALNRDKLYDKINEACTNEGVSIGRKQNIDNNIKKLIDFEVLYEADGNIILDKEAADELEELKFRTEPKYRSTIRSLVINYLKSKNNKETSLQEIWKIAKIYYPHNIVKTNFYKIFDNASIFNKTSIDNKQYLSLNVDLLPVPKDFTEEVEDPLDDATRVASTEAVELKTRVKFNLEEITYQLKKELKNGFNMSEVEIDNGISRFYRTLKSNDKYSRWGESLLQSIYELWYTKTDFYDREVCLIKLTTNFETYIRKFQPTHKETMGLVELLKSYPELSELYSYKFECRNIDSRYIDYPKRNHSKNLHSLIYFRNLYAHNTDDDNLDMGISNQIGYATNFIALYVYVALLFGQKN